MIHWNPSPDIFSFGPIHIRWYSLMFVAGFTIGYFIVKWMCRLEKKNFEELQDLLIYLVIGTTVGARLGHCLFYEPEYYLKHPLEILMIWHGGLASHGGTIGVMLALWIFSRRHPQFSFMWLLDRISVPVALTAAFIRFGNLMNSEIVGRPTDVPWAFIFDRVDQMPRHPTQIYESLTYLVLFFVLMWIYKKVRPLPAGLIFGVSMIWIFLSRIGWELLKENQVAFENQMSWNMGQLLSVPFVVLGIYLVIKALKNKPAGTRSRA